MQKIDFTQKKSDFLIKIFRTVFADEFSSALSRYLKKISHDGDKTLAKTVYAKIESIFSYQIFDAVIQVEDSNDYSNIGQSWPIALIDPKKKSRIAALNHLELRSLDYKLITGEEIQKITRSLLNRLRAEDNSYILRKILALKSWDSLLSSSPSRSTELCEIIIKLGQKWAYIPEVIESLALFIGKFLPMGETGESGLEGDQKLSLEILIWSNDKSQNSWISGMLENSESLKLLGLCEDFLFNKNLLSDFIGELRGFLLKKLKKGEVAGFDGFVEWVLKLRASFKLDCASFGEELLGQLTTLLKKLLGKSGNGVVKFHALKLVNCCFILKRSMVFRQQGGPAEVNSENYVARDAFLESFDAANQKYSLVVEILALLNFGYFLENKNQLCSFISS